MELTMNMVQQHSCYQACIVGKTCWLPIYSDWDSDNILFVWLVNHSKNTFCIFQ